MPLRLPRPKAKLLLWSALAVALLLLGSRTAGRLRDSADLVQHSQAFQRAVERPQARLLIVGDSTAVGTGGTAAQHSVAGQLGAAYPRLHIENRGRNGARFGDVLQQLEGAERFDIVLIQAGGNDVISMADLDSVGGSIERALLRARERADLVVVMPAGNVGNAPLFFPPVTWVLSWRSRQLHAIVRASAARQGAVYVNLYKERSDDPFVQRPELNARDQLHPSDAGYQLWYHELMAQAGLATRLGPPQPPQG